MFCYNCGHEVDKNAVVCVKCGVALKPKAQQPIQTVSIAVNKEKKGKGIASMVLGICAAIFVLSTLINIQTALDQVYYYTTMGEVFGFAFGYTLIQYSLSITGFCLACVERTKSKNGYNTAGFILCLTSIILTTLEFIIVLFS